MENMSSPHEKNDGNIEAEESYDTQNCGDDGSYSGGIEEKSNELYENHVEENENRDDDGNDCVPIDCSGEQEGKSTEEGGGDNNDEKNEIDMNADISANSDKNDTSLKFFVGGIPPDCWEDDVLKHFAKFGTVKEVQVMKDAGNGRNRGFCFVTMTDRSTRNAVFNAEHKIKNKKVDVREMQPQNLNRKIFVGGINVIFNEDNIRDYFSKFGNVEKVTIMRDPEDKRSRGFGFVVFCDETAVKEVLKVKLHQINDEYKVEVRAAEARPKNSYRTPPPATPFVSTAGYYQAAMYNQWGRTAAFMGGTSPYGYTGYGYMPPYSPPTGGRAAFPPYASPPQPTMYNYAAAAAYGPQRTSPIAPRGRGTYRMGPY